MLANQQAFAGFDWVLSIASGCTLQLSETLGENRPLDILTFVQQQTTAHSLELLPLDADVAVQLPCTSVNGLRNSDDVTSVLQRIPGLRLHPVGQPGKCCGAAGDHLITERAQAVKLRQPLLDQLLELQPAYLVSSNVGCALHLAEGARRQGLKLETLHPVELLARQLTTAEATAQQAMR